MKKSIVIIIAIAACAAHTRATIVDLVNWSSKYKIAVTDNKGKWIQIAPRTRTQGDVNGFNLHIRACDGTSRTCGFTSTGNFTWKGNESMQYPIAINAEIIEGKTVLVLDAGKSFFSGLTSSAPSISNTVKILALSPTTDRRIIKIVDNIKFVAPGATPQPSSTQTPPPSIGAKASNQITDKQLQADPIMLTPHDITTLSIAQRFTLLGVDPKLATGYPGDHAENARLQSFARQLQPKIANTSSQIKSRYRKLSMKYHPDKGGTKPAMQVLNDTFRLFDPSGSLLE